MFAPNPRAPRAARSRRIAPGVIASLAVAASAAAQSGSDPGFPRMPDDRSSFGSAPSVRFAERLPVFFPPSPPPMGRPVVPNAAAGVRFPAPPELANYVTEFFYPALGTRLATGTLNEKLRRQLNAYRADKLALQNELVAEVDRLRGAESGTRSEALATLARRQAPKIAELEQHAEQLRRDLITSDQNWSALRQWHLSDKQRRGFSPIEIAQVMRAYAFYQNHLLPAQRRLLREISIELLFAAESTAAATAAQPFTFFPPEPARVLFPDELTPEVAARLTTYQTRKSELKKELYDAVHEADGATFSFLRGSPMKALAEKQAARLNELEALAEEIRRGLSAAPAARVERSPLPPDLDARVQRMIATYLAAQRDAAKKIDAILLQAKNLPLQATYRFEGENLRFLVVPLRGGRGGPGAAAGRGGAGAAGGATDPRVDAVRAEISAVADDYGRRLADMLNERESIRLAIGEAMGTAKGGEGDRALIAAMRIANQKEAAQAFSDYRTAVFEPGFSPEQRRLLFDRVVERLELPLPRAELQPTILADTW